jgi:hypothetical protein
MTWLLEVFAKRSIVMAQRPVTLPRVDPTKIGPGVGFDLDLRAAGDWLHMLRV